MDAYWRRYFDDKFEEGLRALLPEAQRWNDLMHEFPERFTHYHLKVRIPMEAITRELLEDDQCWEWEKKNK